MSYFVEYEVKRIRESVIEESDPSNIKSLYNKANTFKDIDTSNMENLLHYFINNSKTSGDLLNEIYYQHFKGKNKSRNLLVNFISNPNMKNPDVLEDMLNHPYSDVRWSVVRNGHLSKEALERIWNQDTDYDVRYEAERQLNKLKKKSN